MEMIRYARSSCTTGLPEEGLESARLFLFAGDLQLVFPGAHVIQRERMDGLVRRQPSQAGPSPRLAAALFGSSLYGRLQAVKSLLLRFNRGAHPYPVVRVVLVILEKSGEELTGAGSIPLAQALRWRIGAAIPRD